jgi:hypothetical protein
MAEDVTNPDYLTRPELGMRSARILSGRGTEAPGYRLVGSGKSAPSEGLQDVTIVKMVNPQGGQGPVSQYRDARQYERNANILSVNRRRVQRAVSPSSFGTAKVIRPPRTTIRRMTGSGQGVVSFA